MNQGRYQRQITLSEFGPQAQQRLRDSSVLVVGVGGLGIPVLQYLNAMGVGCLGLVDQDTVDETNLHRQVLYAEDDVGLSKVEVAVNKLRSQNSHTKLVIHDTFLVKDNALEIIKDYDLVVDASDNFATRYLINDACVILKKAFIYGALHGFEGQVSVFNHQGGPTYRCLFPQMPNADEIPNCDQNGVLGVLPGIIGNFQALEAVKLLTGIGKLLSGRLMIYDGLEQNIHHIKFHLVPVNQDVKELAENYDLTPCDPTLEILPEDLEEVLTNSADLKLVDVRTADEYDRYHLSGTVNIPLDQLATRLSDLNDRTTICFICQSGIRSQKALHWLRSENKSINVFHLKGGINAYKILAG